MLELYRYFGLKSNKNNYKKMGLLIILKYFSKFFDCILPIFRIVFNYCLQVLVGFIEKDFYFLFFIKFIVGVL